MTLHDLFIAAMDHFGLFGDPDSKNPLESDLRKEIPIDKAIKILIQKLN